jgi:hypothetical protein
MINSYTSWQPLEEVIVGSTFLPEYFDYIENRQVRNQLQQILYETGQDLDNLSKVIKSYGAIVHRPKLAPKDKFINNQINNDGTWIPLPPLTPRDWQITLGEKLLRILPMFELDAVCNKFAKQVINPHQDDSGPRYKSNCILNGASASCIVRVGRDVFFDNSEWLKPEQSRWIIENVLGSEYRTHEAVTDGHSDAVFAILKPGVILTSKHDEKIDLAGEFPGWDVYKILDSSIDAAIRVGKFKQENFNGRWYVQGQNPTPEFSAFVDTYLKNWVGYVKETVFDVNCLVLDEQHVIFSAYNKDVFDFCKKHQIEPIICPLRHSYFWDGGISCCTQDLRRRGGLETYL